MVHTFSCLYKDFAIDVESGSCFEIDSLTKALIEQKNSLDIGDFLASYAKAQIDEAKLEIDEFIKRGSLFSESNFNFESTPIDQVKALCVNISHKCNLACSYCFAGGGDYHSKETTSKNMSLATAKACIDFLIKNSGNRYNLEIDFFGGEPLLNYQTIKDAVAYGREQEKLYNKNFKFTVTTNALNLTEEMIDYFNKEMHNVVISIDGRENIHNKARPDLKGGVTFSKVVKNALVLKKKRQTSYYIRGTFTANNLDFSKDVIALADLGFDQISLEPVVLPDNHPLAIKEEHLPILLNQYEILAAEYQKRKGTDKAFNFFHFNIDLKGGPCLKKRLSGCGVGGEYLCVSVDGSIYPCHRFDGMKEYRMGDIESGIKNKEISYYFQKSNLLTKPHCNNCFAKYFCSGGCNANNLEFGGNINAAHKISCELMKKRIECAIALKVICS
ncbi:MAG: thioether cross-link-forming SCIFF peptide maturase [Firmicutes bacterium]|nr:thioether cross-link-forming SCIFF peptide maturase [Bacillota bacterium]